MTELLAKSRGHGELTLEQHLADTEQAATALFRPGTRWGDRWPEFFRLDRDDPRFRLELRASALFHDIGKANEDFQQAVGGNGFHAQTLRHEHLSALVMSLPAVRGWLSQAHIDVDICVAAVLSHHLKATEQDGEWPWAKFRESPRLRLRLDDPRVAEILNRIASLLQIPAPPTLPSGVVDSPFGEPWKTALSKGVKAAKDLGRSLDKDAARRRRLVAVKVGLIVADAAASALFRVGAGLDSWIDQVAHAEALSADQIAMDVIGARLRAIGPTASLHPFQVLASQSGPRSLLLAACGTGKTLAAWKWAEAQARARPIGRVIFLYPTRGTATEGYRDYAAWAPEGEAILLHGTAEYELEKMLECPPESAREKNLTLTEAEERLFALGLWGRRYFSATVDQFLGAMEHRYEALCLLPALADAAVIIDEVHSFDRKMFDALVAFLKEFDVPTLCMTATLPAGRRAELEDAGLRQFPSKTDAPALADLEAKERAPRYRLRRTANAADAEVIALAAYKAGQRVLWVVNQVARAQALASRLSALLGVEVLCYHSRFRLVDRQRAHAHTVKAFQREGAPAIAVTTQVCEMSLDLDAEVLLTEECPVTSLVQRFGRANRHLRRPGKLAEIVTYPPERALPYSRRDLEGVEEFLRGLEGRSFCQAELSERIEELAGHETGATGSSSLFFSGYYAVPREFRDIDQFARASILSSDLARAAALAKAGKAIAELIVPVPRRYVVSLPPDSGLPSWLGLADASRYDPAVGFVAPEKETP